MLDILRTIKNLVYPTEDHSRKRRAPIDEFIPVSAKMRRTDISRLSSSSEEDWYTPGLTSTAKRRTSLRNYKPNSSNELPIVNVDDDDDIQEIIKIKPNLNKSYNKRHFSSTPRQTCILNGNNNDDVTFLKSTQVQRKLDAKKNSLEYVKPYSYLKDSNKRSSMKNGTKTRDYSSNIFKTASEVRSKLGLNKRLQRSSALDQTFRLEEKRKYQQLLVQAAQTPTNSFSKYSTPSGALFSYGTGSRGKKIVDAVLNNVKPPVLIDLTDNDGRFLKKKPILSTKDTIIKVLDDYENDAVEIKDSASDTEVLPTPPSPKPDIKVPRVNSFKQIVSSVEPSHGDWLRNLIEKYRQGVRNCEKEINAKVVHAEKLKEINSEIHSQRLGHQLAKFLHIKDAVLPINTVEEVAFPPIADEDEARIDVAFNSRANKDEVLSAKFNLRITRRDILTLANTNWLNDEVINFYMNLIIERGKLPQWPNAYAMNTFFYPKLLKDGHSSLKRWTRRVDLFSYDYIAVPIHLGVHWCMSIISFRNHTIKYYDSMGSANKQCTEALLMYLEDEHLDKKHSEYDTSDWKLESVENIPHQMNGSDCGMFACTFAEVLTRGAKISFSQKHMPYLRRKMVLEILNGELMIQ